MHQVCLYDPLPRNYEKGVFAIEVFGVAFGNRSLIEAEKTALEYCRRKGGTDPKIKWSFKDNGSPNFG
jgi:hypothetical protein